LVGVEHCVGRQCIFNRCEYNANEQFKAVFGENRVLWQFTM